MVDWIAVAIGPGLSEASEIPDNPLFYEKPGQNGWEYAEEGLPNVTEFRNALGKGKSYLKPGGELEKLAPSLPFQARTYYFQGRNGMWRYSDHTYFDVSNFMTPEQIAEYGGIPNRRG